MAKQLTVCLAVVVIGAVLGANVYNSVVDATSWGTSIPQSLTTARAYYAAVDPGTFFRVASPLAQVLALLVLIVCWRLPGARRLAASALAASVLADVVTFAYFYPRNAILFGDATDVAVLRQALQEWMRMNHVRSALVLVALGCELTVLIRLAALSAQRSPL